MAEEMAEKHVQAAPRLAFSLTLNYQLMCYS